MALINKLLVGESLVGEGNEVAHIDLIIGPRGSAAELAFANALVNNKDGFTTLLAVVAPNLLTKPNTILFNKVTIKGAKQAVQMFGPAQAGVAKAVADSVAEGIIPVSEADDLFICVGVFIHWDASDDAKIQDYNYAATKEALARAIKGEPKAAEVVDVTAMPKILLRVLRLAARYPGRLTAALCTVRRGARRSPDGDSAVPTPLGRGRRAQTRRGAAH